MSFIHIISVNLHYNHVSVLEGKATITKVDSQRLEHKKFTYFSCDISGQLRLYFTVIQGLRLIKTLPSSDGGRQYCHCHFHSIQSEGRNGMKMSDSLTGKQDHGVHEHSELFKEKPEGEIRTVSFNVSLTILEDLTNHINGLLTLNIVKERISVKNYIKLFTF